MRQTNFTQISDAEDEIEAAAAEGRQSINSSSLDAKALIKELRGIAEEEAERALFEATQRLAAMQDMDMLTHNPEKKLDLDACYDKIKREKENFDHMLRTAELVLQGRIDVELPRSDGTIQFKDEESHGFSKGSSGKASPTERTALSSSGTVVKEREPLCDAWGILFFTIVMAGAANMLAIYFKLNVILTVGIVCVVSVVGQLWFVIFRSSQFWKYYDIQTQRALKVLDDGLEILDRSLLDPVEAILVQAECVRRVYAPVELLAYEKEDELSSIIPDAGDLKAPLLPFPLRLTTKVNQTKTAVTGAAADYLPTYQPTCCYSFFVPLLLLALFNGITMSAMLFYIPTDTPRSNTDFTPYTLQPCIVEFTLTTLAALVSYLWTRESRVHFQMNRHLGELEKIANANLENRELDKLVTSVCKNGLPKVKTQINEFFTAAKTLIRELKQLDAQKPNPGGFE